MYLNNDGTILEDFARLIIDNNGLVKNGRQDIKVFSIYTKGKCIYANDKDGNEFEIKLLPYTNILSLYRPRKINNHKPDSILFVEDYFDFLNHIA